MSERKYALIKLGTGDYLLPSNDGRALWRIAKYEDGPSFGLEGWTRDRMVWGTCRWNRPWDGQVSREDALEWSHWDLDSMCLESRREAIEDVLSCAETPDA